MTKFIDENQASMPQRYVQVTVQVGEDKDLQNLEILTKILRDATPLKRKAYLEYLHVRFVEGGSDE